jgi:hypothetical protein
MAYGDNRSEVETDAFPSSIDAGWDNPFANFVGWSWSSSGNIVPDDLSNGNCCIRSKTALNDDQYGSLTVNGTPGTDASAAVILRCAPTTNEAHYRCYNQHNSNRWAIYEYFDGASFGVLATDNTSYSELTDGEVIFGEVEGTAIRMGDNTSGSDTQRVATTDATLTGGEVGIGCFVGSGTLAVSAFTSGNIASGGGGAPLFANHINMMAGN